MNAASKKLVTFGVVVTMGAATNAAAQAGDVAVLDRGSSVVSFTVGGMIPDVGEHLAEFDSDVQGEVDFGARYQYHLTPHFALEGNFLFSPSDHEFIGPADPDNIPDFLLEDITDPDLSPNDVDKFYYTANAVWNILSGGRVLPFVTGGGGAVTLDVENASTINKFVGNFGGGVLIAINELIAARVEVRDYIYTFDDPDLETQRALVLPEDFDETINDLSFTAGISLMF